MIIMWLMHAMPPTISFSGGPPCSEVSGGFFRHVCHWWKWIMVHRGHAIRIPPPTWRRQVFEPSDHLGFLHPWRSRLGKTFFFSCVFLEKMQDFWNMRWWNHRFLSLSVLLSMKKLKSSLPVKISLNNFLTLRWKFAFSPLRLSNYGTSKATTCRGHFSWQQLRLGEKYLRQFFQFFPCFFKAV